MTQLRQFRGTPPGLWTLWITFLDFSRKPRNQQASAALGPRNCVIVGRQPPLPPEPPFDEVTPGEKPGVFFWRNPEPRPSWRRPSDTGRCVGNLPSTTFSLTPLGALHVHDRLD